MNDRSFLDSMGPRLQFGADQLYEAKRKRDEEAAKVLEPTEEDPETKKKMEEARGIERKAKGRASTVLTGGQGLTGSANSASRILLGA